MEKIILWVVLLIGAFAYEWIKKYIHNKEGDDRSERQPRQPRRDSRHPHTRPAPAPPQVVLDFERTDRSEAPHTAATPAKRPTRLRPATKKAGSPLSESVSGLSATSEDASAPGETIAAFEAENAARAAHFARWRQAVVDTQILERKF